MVALNSKTTGQKVAISPLLSGPDTAQSREGVSLLCQGWVYFGLEALTTLRPTFGLNSPGNGRTMLRAPPSWLDIPDVHLLKLSLHQP